MGRGLCKSDAPAPSESPLPLGHSVEKHFRVRRLGCPSSHPPRRAHRSSAPCPMEHMRSHIGVPPRRPNHTSTSVIHHPLLSGLAVPPPASITQVTRRSNNRALIDAPHLAHPPSCATEPDSYFPYESCFIALIFRTSVSDSLLASPLVLLTDPRGCAKSPLVRAPTARVPLVTSGIEPRSPSNSLHQTDQDFQPLEA